MMLTEFENLTGQMVDLIWGLPLVVALCFSGIFLTFYLNFPQIRYFKKAIGIIFSSKDDQSSGEISHFQAFCAALSATIGLGNIAGVAIAISIGGPGAVFWLWVAGFFGMATKFTEVTLALIYREKSESGHFHGGPMFTIKNGLHKSFKPLAGLYAFFIILSSLGSGNMFQSNQMAQILQSSLNVPLWISGLVLAILTGLILIGGIKRIGKVAETLVPAMVGIFLVACTSILLMNLSLIPSLIWQIFHDAFNGTAAMGGFAGVAFKQVLITGIKRASFVNEAGMGTAAMAHSAARSTPAQEGLVAMLEPFVDTIVVCTLTSLALLITNAWTQPNIYGADMTAWAFASQLGSTGRGIVVLTVILFAFSTIISCAYYGEQGTTYLWGENSIKYFRLLTVVFVFLGAITELNIVINLSDATYGLLAIPNLIATFILMKKAKQELGSVS